MGRKTKKKKWTKEEDLLIRGLRLKGFSVKEIQKKIPNRTESAVSSRVYSLRLRRKKVPDWTSKENDLLWNMKGDGHEFEDIADRLGRSENACRIQYSRLLRLGRSMGNEARQAPTDIKKHFKEGQKIKGGVLEYVRTVNKSRLHLFRHVEAGYRISFSDSQLVGRGI